MRNTKLALTTEEIVNLIGMQNELPRYREEFMRLINSYMVLERLVGELEEESQKSLGGVRQTESVGTKGKVERATKLIKDSKVDKKESALRFIQECREDVADSDKNEDSKLLMPRRDSATRITLRSRLKEAEALFMNGYTIREIAAKFGVYHVPMSESLHELPWFTRDMQMEDAKGRKIYKILIGFSINRIEDIEERVAEIVDMYGISNYTAQHIINRTKRRVSGDLMKDK